MAALKTIDRADWPQSPQPEDSVISPEHLALFDFAQRLGSVTTNDEPGIAEACDVRQHANLLMSLLSPPPHLVRDDGEHSSVRAASPNEHHYMSDASTSSATTATASTQHRRDSFRFSHPSLSLDSKWRSERPLRTPCTAPDKDEETEENESSLPAVLLGRALKADDREAQRLSADAMARNILLSFQKAIMWRIKAWMNALSASLVRQEQEMRRKNATEQELRELLKTSEARLFIKLREVTQTIEVQNAETCFHVLPQRVQKKHEEESEVQVIKRRRIESEDSELKMGETEYEYTVCHALEFDGRIQLNTPAGHSEIKLEVPGFIEGTFLSSEPGMEELTAVEVEIDTNILASMVEKSCRVVVRSSLEHVMRKEDPPRASLPQKNTERAAASSPFPRFQGTSVIGQSPTPGAAPAAIVTPRSKSFPFLAEGMGEPISLQIPDDLDAAASNPRRISPQPRPASGMHFTPSTPMKRGETMPPPCMVSPGPAIETFQQTDLKLSKRGRPRESDDKGPNLPVLVEVACAAIQAKTGLAAGQ